MVKRGMGEITAGQRCPIRYYHEPHQNHDQHHHHRHITACTTATTATTTATTTMPTAVLARFLNQASTPKPVGVGSSLVEFLEGPPHGRLPWGP